MHRFCRLRRRTQLFSVVRRSMTAINQNDIGVPAIPTVGIIIIGDEILKGQVVDSNSHFLCKRLFSLGVKVKKISVIADDIDSIAAEVSDLSPKYTHVITAGGIGPTHDDITFEGIAKAFGETVQPNADLVRICREEFGTEDIRSPNLKLAFVPESAVLHYGIDAQTGQKHKYPLVATRNVYVFPGVPCLMENAFLMLQGLFRNPSTQFHVAELYVNEAEFKIAGILNEANVQFKERVILGSYPTLNNSYYKVRLSLESEEESAIREMLEFLRRRLPEGSTVAYDKDPVGNAVCALRARLSGSLQGAPHPHPGADELNVAPHPHPGADELNVAPHPHPGADELNVAPHPHPGADELNVAPHPHPGADELNEAPHRHPGADELNEAVAVIRQALEKYTLDQVCVGFNGGKDCTALLHLVYAIVKEKYPDSAVRLKALYIRRGRSFPEVELFIKTATERYNLDLVPITGQIKDALCELRRLHPQIQAVFMGTRITDPYSHKLTTFIATDAGWPAFMRINPLLHWHYCHLWHFLRALSLPYCTLYDRGYTSLGSMENTHPNPSLEEVDERGIITYQPAYKLVDGTKERDGRN